MGKRKGRHTDFTLFSHFVKIKTTTLLNKQYNYSSQCYKANEANIASFHISALRSSNAQFRERSASWAKSSVTKRRTSAQTEQEVVST